MKKHTYSYIKEQIEKVKGYKLLSKEYINNSTKLEVQCPEGHKYEVSYNNFKRGNRCPECAGNRNIKLTYKFVKEQIEKVKGYKLLSKEYVDNRTKLEVQCPEGHEYEVSYSNFKRGNRCPVCAGNKKLTYEFVKEQIKKVKGYKLLSKEYVNAITKLEIQCPKGHKYEVQYASFKQGNRCQQCSGNKNIKLTYEFIKEQIENVKGYKLLSKEYINGSTKIEVQCPEGHKYKVTYNNFKQGKRCSICSTKIEADKKRHSYSYIKEQIESEEGYKLLSKEYVNNVSKLEVQCPEGHKYEVAYCNFSRGKRCPECNLKCVTSKGEKEVLQIVKTLINKEVVIEENDRTQIINPLTGHNLELDIWIPSLNKAIEYNGEYWHSDDATKARDREKARQCKEKGIDLLVIEENDWQEQNQKIVNEIRVFLQTKERK